MANTRRKGKENEKTVMWPSAWPYYIRDVLIAPAVLRSMAVCQKVKGLVILEEMRNTKIHLWDLASECKKPSGKWHKGQGEFLWDWQGDSSESHLSVRRRSVRWHQTQHFDMNSWQQLKTWATSPGLNWKSSHAIPLTWLPFVEIHLLVTFKCVLEGESHEISKSISFEVKLHHKIFYKEIIIWTKKIRNILELLKCFRIVWQLCIFPLFYYCKKWLIIFTIFM